MNTWTLRGVASGYSRSESGFDPPLEVDRTNPDSVSTGLHVNVIDPDSIRIQVSM